MIDTHTHLNDPKYDDDLEQVIARAVGAGVERMIVCGYDAESSNRAVELAERYEAVYAAVGVHPHDASRSTPVIEDEILELAGRDKVVAIGEIGLDFHYDFSPRPNQVAVLERHLVMAEDLGLPVIVHSRDADREILQVTAGHASKLAGCVFHCFLSDEKQAQAALELGFHIGIAGPVTFKSSGELRRVVEMCPMDRLLIETDCPYMSPAPFRGKRNEPANVTCVVEEIARIKGVSVDSVAEATTRNARGLFARMQ